LCKNGKQYNYCCTETPKVFKNCKWVGDAVKLLNEKYCSDACPHGSTRIAEQQVKTLFNANKPANSMDCVDGAEAYCCAGDKESDKDERSIIVYQDKDAKEFDYALRRFLRDPVCPDEEVQFGSDDGLSSDEGISARNHLQGRATDNSAVLSVLLGIMGVWVTSQHPRQDLTDIYNRDVREAGFAENAANLTTFTHLLYQNDWNGRPRYSGRAVARMTLCNLAESREGLENLATLPEALCEVPSSTGSEARKRNLQARTINVAVMEDRGGRNEIQPSAAYIFTAIRLGHLSLHYMRWLRTGNQQQVILEVAYWIGPSPGVEDPANSYRNQYRDRSHVNAADRWVIIHFHIPLGDNTFWTEPNGVNDYYLGVSSFGMYHSQSVHQMRRPRGYRGPIDDRAEWM
jgi:chitinase